MSKNQKASGITNIINYDNSGNISFVSGSTTLMSVSSSGAVLLTGTMSGGVAVSASYAYTASSATNAFNSISASYAYTASSATNAFSASKSISSSYSDTASFANNFTVLGNLTVFGTQSVQYITSSQLNVANNIINVNVGTPGVRFGGLAVYDSGSQVGATGSLLWDSQNNHWVYQQVTGSTYTGGMLISGPRNTGGLGNEQGTTSGSLMKGQGGDHVTSSAIFEDGYKATFYTNSLVVSSSGLVSMGTSNPATNRKLTVAGGAQFTYTDNGGASFNIIPGATGDAGTDFNLSYYTGTGYGPLTFTLAGSERMRITPGGNLQLNGASGVAAITTDSNANVIGLFTSSSVIDGAPRIEVTGTTYPSTPSTAFIRANTVRFTLNAASAETMRITSAGLVGIGTTNPTAMLDIYHPSNGYVSIGLQGYSGATKWYLTSGISGDTIQDFSISNNNTGTSPKFRISSTGAAAFSSTISAYTNIGVINSGAQGPVLATTSTYADGYRATVRLTNTHTGGKQWDIYSTNVADGVYGAGKFAIANATDSITAISIQSGGIVTKPNQMFVMGGMGSDQSITTSNPTTLNFVTNGSYSWYNQNVGSCWNNSTYTLTAPATGIYVVNVSVYTSAYAINQIALYVNGSRKNSIPTGYGTAIAGGSAMVILQAGDTLNLRVFNDATTVTLYGNAYHSWFNIYFLG